GCAAPGSWCGAARRRRWPARSVAALAPDAVLELADRREAGDLVAPDLDAELLLDRVDDVDVGERVPPLHVAGRGRLGERDPVVAAHVADDLLHLGVHRVRHRSPRRT